MKLLRMGVEVVQFSIRSDDKFQIDVIGKQNSQGVQIIDSSLSRAVEKAVKEFSNSSK